MRIILTFFFGLWMMACIPEEEDYIHSIQGRWFQDAGVTEDPELFYRNEIIFNADGTYEETHTIVKTKDVDAVVGYVTLLTGEYQVVGKILRRFNIKQFSNQSGTPYNDREQLVFEQATEELPELGLILDKSGNELTLDYLIGQQCPDFAMCIEFQTYYRSH